MTGQIQSQLDQVLSLAAQNVSADDMEFTVAAANFLREHGPAIRAAVGGDKPRCGEEHYELDAYIWRRESTQSWVLEVSGCINDTTFIARHSEPLTTKPQDVASLPSLYAVGGEAVDLSAFRPAVLAWQREGERRWKDDKDVFHLELGPNHYRAFDLLDLIDKNASPTAAVGVGALPEPEGEMKWTRSAGVCIQPEPGYTAEQMREYRLSGGVSADALRQYISGLRLVQKVNENDGTERSNGKAFAFGVVANELAALIGKEA